MPDVFYSSIFKALTERIQIRFDKVSELHKRLYDNDIFPKYLDWDTPTISTTFEEMIGEYGMTIMAPTIGENSNEAVMGRDGLKTLAEKMLTHSISVPMTIQEYRKVLELLDSKALSDSAKTQQLVKLMFKDVDAAVKAVLAKIDYIFLNTLFNEGKMELTDENNPEGGARGLIDFNQPAENIASVKTAWTEDNLSKIDPMDDIEQVIDAASDKVVFKEVLCSPSRISMMRRSSSMKKMIWGSDKSSRLVSLADINSYMQSNGYPVFTPLRRQMQIQNGSSRKLVSPLNENNLVFVPDGKLGVIKNAFVNSELKADPRVTYANYGRVRVSKWGVGEVENSKGVEFTKAECIALPVITEMEGIYTLKTGE